MKYTFHHAVKLRHAMFCIAPEALDSVDVVGLVDNWWTVPGVYFLNKSVRRLRSLSDCAICTSVRFSSERFEYLPDHLTYIGWAWGKNDSICLDAFLLVSFTHRILEIRP
jgi:hypothetical protein